MHNPHKTNTIENNNSKLKDGQLKTVKNMYFKFNCDYDDKKKIQRPI